jgi:hypothetical protein
MKLKIVNKSDWPTPALKILCEFIGKETGLNNSYTVIFENFKSNSWWDGWAIREYRRCCIKFNRRFKPKCKYPVEWRTDLGNKFPSPLLTANNRIELFVRLITHEMSHLYGAIPKRPYKGTLKAIKDELFCEHMATLVVDILRRKWPKLRKKIWLAMRKEHDANKK